MENASKALIMAAGILISIIVISTATYLFATFGKFSERIDNNLSQQDIDRFNGQFLKYDGTECSVYDIVTVINYARNSNEKYDEFKNTNSATREQYRGQNNMYVLVDVENDTEYKNINETVDIKDIENFIQARNEQISGGEFACRYDCNVEYNSNTKIVKSITFTRK